jgi:hypothetical protein
MIHYPTYLAYGQQQLSVRLLFIGHAPWLELDE